MEVGVNKYDIIYNKLFSAIIEFNGVDKLDYGIQYLTELEKIHELVHKLTISLTDEP